MLIPAVAGLAVMCMSFVGVLFSSRLLSRWLARRLTYLATFSGGVFAVITYHLITESLHEARWGITLIALASGFIFMQIVERLAPSHHHHHDVAHSHAHTHIDGRSVLISDAFHNIGDGVILVGAFAANVWIGIAATVGILIHECVQEIAEYFVLREAGYTGAQALSRNFAVSATIFIGIIGATLLHESPIFTLLSGIAAGGFLSVILTDLIPHARHSIARHGGFLQHVLAALLGIALMLVVQTLLPHEPHEDAGRAVAHLSQHEL